MAEAAARPRPPSKPLSDKLPQPTEVIKSKHSEYEVILLLGQGGFGAVYEVKQFGREERMAMKCETVDTRKQCLTMDCRVLRGAMQIHSPHFCTLVDRGKVPDRFRFVIMKLVGKNLWDLRMERPDQRFTLNTSLKVAEQCLISIEDLHRIGYLHRDIKPGNFAIGRPEAKEQQIVFMLDFGLCRKFAGEGPKDLRIPRKTAPFRGTTRYAPIAALRQVEQSRKDDVEAWLYVVVEWTSGALPWRKVSGADKEEVLRMKEEAREPGPAMDKLLTDCPRKHFQTIIDYLKTLQYESIPDYTYLFYCLQNACKVNFIGDHEPLDWDPNNKYIGQTKADRDKRANLRVKTETKDTFKDEENEDLGNNNAKNP